jgi:hypothetical protein
MIHGDPHLLRIKWLRRPHTAVFRIRRHPNMTSATRKTLWAVGILVVLALALPVSNLLTASPTGTALTRVPPKDAEAAKVTRVLEESCASCHVPDVKAPFYAGLPVAKTLIERDVRDGLRSFDLARGLAPSAGGLVPEPVLAKIEREVKDGEMPPTPYVALHWNAALGGEKKAAVLAWVKAQRAAQAAPGVPEPMKTALLRPIPDKLDVDPRKTRSPARHATT